MNKQILKIIKNQTKKYKNLLGSLILFLISLFLINSENQRTAQKILGEKTRLKLDQQTIIYLEQILEERPNYRDGWIQLAAAYYKTGDKQKAKQAIEKAKELDPINEVILNFEKLIGD